MNPCHIELDIPSLVGAVSSAQTAVPGTSPPHHLAELYANTSLPTLQSIRVLDLSSSPGDANAPLRGVLRVVDLADSPRFTALSYIWGAGAAPRNEPVISCNDGYILPITQNCRDALAALRNHHSAEPEGLTIWVDAICINQKDDKEKGVQLPLMGTIYTFAETVFVWLGNGTPGTRQTVAWLNHATRRLPGRPGNPWLCGPKKMMTVERDFLWESWRWIPLKVRNLTSISIGDRICSKWIPGISASMPEPKDVQDLLKNDWLGRVWTFQEIILASNPILVCGSESITWSRFQTGLLLPREMNKKSEGFTGLALFSALYESYDKENHNGVADWPDLLPWWQLFEVWATAYRPLGWNGIALRNLAGRPADEGGWSARGYRMERVDRKLVSSLAAFWVLVILWVVWIPILAGLFLAGFITTHLAIGVVGIILCLGVLYYTFISLYLVCAGLWTFDKVGSSGSTSLVSVLKVLRERRAGDPKDRAYALYGVLASMGVGKLAEPRYNKLLGEVYHGFFLDLIRWKPSLIALLVDAGPTLPGAPSWVPDWSTIRERGWIPSEVVYSAASPSWTSSEVDYSLSEDRRAITLRGAILGKVTVTFGPFKPTGCSSLEDLQDIGMETLPNLWAGLYDIWCWIAEIRKGVPVSRIYDSVARAVLNVLTADSFSKSTENAAVFNELYLVMMECQEGPQESFTQRLLVSLSKNHEALKYAISFVDRLAGKRSLFFSRDGHIGTGPPDMVAGDHIVVLDGVPVPMILRTSQNDDEVDSYTVVGPANVPGYFRVTEREILNEETGKWEDGNAKNRDPRAALLHWKRLWLC